MPNDAALHEFRALVLFALQRYDDAAAALYAVLTAGPGWDWATLSRAVSQCFGVYTAATGARELLHPESGILLGPVRAGVPLLDPRAYPRGPPDVEAGRRTSTPGQSLAAVVPANRSGDGGRIRRLLHPQPPCLRRHRLSRRHRFSRRMRPPRARKAGWKEPGRLSRTRIPRSRSPSRIRATSPGRSPIRVRAGNSRGR